MNRKEIKELAKAKIEGNKWNIWWPLLIIVALESILGNAFGPSVIYDEITSAVKITSSGSLMGGIVGLVFGVVLAGYFKYIMDFVRTGKFDSNTIIDTIKSKWVNILIAEVLVSIIVFLCSLLFVVPGIIMALAYAFATFLVIDTDIAGNEALSKSREMMNGYKWDYFVFLLSFIGWIVLVPFTLGILLIWLVPYMIVAEVIYYDKLKEKKLKNKR